MLTASDLNEADYMKFLKFNVKNRLQEEIFGTVLSANPDERSMMFTDVVDYSIECKENGEEDLTASPSIADFFDLDNRDELPSHEEHHFIAQLSSENQQIIFGQDVVEAGALYRLSNGIYCPYCDSSELEAISEIDVDGGDAMIDIACKRCGTEWVDVFTLTTFVEREA